MTTAGDRVASEPKYYAVKRHLLDFIGSLEPGAAVPTERDLALQMQTSRTTVRQALGELVIEGRLVRRQGSGTYVAEPKVSWPLYLASFTEQSGRAASRHRQRFWARRGLPPAPSLPSACTSAHGPRSTSSSAFDSPTTGRSHSKPPGCPRYGSPA
jgi:DNA-binding GntR family transcriptional regulator